jgi:hypothetical protein
MITVGWLESRRLPTGQIDREVSTVQVKLDKDWTDPTGATHAAGDIVEVDKVTLAELEATGIVKTDWAGPTGTTDTDT